MYRRSPYSIGEPRLLQCLIGACLIMAGALVTGVVIVCNNAAGPVDPGDQFALVNGRLIDGTGGPVVDDAVVLIKDGRITAAGPARTTAVPDGVREVDVRGSTVLPGFINAHVHNSYNRTNLRAWARAGVTTVRDLASWLPFSVRDELMEDPECARIVAAGPMVSVPGGYPAVPWGSPAILAVESADDARAKVAALIESGADIVKLAIECGQEFQQVIPSLSAEEATAVVETAHEYGTVASAHVLVSSDLERALNAGADDIAHMVIDYLPDSLIAQMIADGVYWVPTLELWHNVGYGRGPAAIGNLRKFVEAGGKVATGTDYDGYSTPFQLGMPMNELEWMLEAGMTPMEVIVASTKYAATTCNLEAELGTVEAGKIADLLIVLGDPLQDIHALRNILMVIHNGKVIGGASWPNP